MFKKKKKSGENWLNSDIMHYLRFAVIPLAVVILIVVIMMSDSDGEQGESTAAQTEDVGGILMAGDDSQMTGETGQDEAVLPGEPDGEEANNTEPGESASVEETSTTADAGTERTEAPSETISYADIDISQYELLQDEIPEVSALVRTYCQAREDRDAELLERLYGVSGMSEEELAEEQRELELVHASIRSYENITSYTIEGPEPDSYVVFPYFELNYREAEVYMPQLTWAYVTKTEEGSYILSQEVSKAVAEYIARVGEREDVKALVAQVKEAQTAAIEADKKLKSIYGGGESEVVIDVEP